MPGPRSIKDDFTDDALMVVGEVISGRSWKALDDGTLVGVTVHQAWTPGPNLAHCPYSETDGVHYNTPRGWLHGYSTFTAHGHKKLNAKHVPGSIGCSCGFWSYHDLAHSSEWAHIGGGRNIVGLIRATGRMTRGSKGYRSQRAQIVALIAPKWNDVDTERVIAIAERYPDARWFADLREAATALHVPLRDDRTTQEIP